MFSCAEGSWPCDLWIRFLSVFPENGEIAKGVIKALVVAALVSAITWLVYRIFRAIQRAWVRFWADDYRWRVQRARDAVGEHSPGLWPNLNSKTRF
jgi:hypothetical protein